MQARGYGRTATLFLEGKMHGRTTKRPIAPRPLARFEPSMSCRETARLRRMACRSSILAPVAATCCKWRSGHRRARAKGPLLYMYEGHATLDSCQGSSNQHMCSLAMSRRARCKQRLCTCWRICSPSSHITSAHPQAILGTNLISAPSVLGESESAAIEPRMFPLDAHLASDSGGVP